MSPLTCSYVLHIYTLLSYPYYPLCLLGFLHVIHLEMCVVFVLVYCVSDMFIVF